VNPTTQNLPMEPVETAGENPININDFASPLTIKNIVAAAHFQPDPEKEIPAELQVILDDPTAFSNNGMKLEADGSLVDCIPLHHLAVNLRNCEYSPKYGQNKGFSGAIFRFRRIVDGHSQAHTYLIFSSGKVVINGGLKSLKDIQPAVKIIQKVFRRLPATSHLRLVTFQTTNIVAAAKLKFPIAIHKLPTLVSMMPSVRDSIRVSYEPELFSGARIHFQSIGDKPLTKETGKPYAALFVNGSFFITGNKTILQLREVHATLIAILITFRDLRTP